MGKTATAKRLGEERGISVHEAEQRLDVNLFLDELPRWDPGGLHHLYLYERMFAHMEAAGQRAQPWNPPGPPAAITGNGISGVEVPTLELLTQETTQEEAIALYHKVYQLKRSPREVTCSADAVEETSIEILETLKEHLQHRWGPTQPERELGKTPLGHMPKWCFMPSCRWPMTTLVAIVVGKSPGRRPCG